MEIYKITKSFPRHEIFALTSQIRRAAISVTTNIVEGYSRRGDKELAQFLNLAIGSRAEVVYLLEFSHRLHYLNEADWKKLQQLGDEVSRLLWRFYAKVRQTVESKV
jgi:four helix bundle protein